jgi:hypothetical protein
LYGSGVNELTSRTLWVSLKLIGLSLVTGGILAASDIGWALYLVPLNIVLSVYILLQEVSEMIDDSVAVDGAV